MPDLAASRLTTIFRLALAPCYALTPEPAFDVGAFAMSSEGFLDLPFSHKDDEQETLEATRRTEERARLRLRMRDVHSERLEKFKTLRPTWIGENCLYLTTHDIVLWSVELDLYNIWFGRVSDLRLVGPCKNAFDCADASLRLEQNRRISAESRIKHRSDHADDQNYCRYTITLAWSSDDIRQEHLWKFETLYESPFYIAGDYKQIYPEKRYLKIHDAYPDFEKIREIDNGARPYHLSPGSTFPDADFSLDLKLD